MNVGVSTEPCHARWELETDAAVLQRRQKQIDYGKRTPGYQCFLQQVPKAQRQPGLHPQTPNKNRRFEPIRQLEEGLLGLRAGPNRSLDYASQKPSRRGRVLCWGKRNSFRVEAVESGGRRTGARWFTPAPFKGTVGRTERSELLRPRPWELEEPRLSRHDWRGKSQWC
ncbi:hypothetical protein AB1E18_005542 [Capra hircus]